MAHEHAHEHAHGHNHGTCSHQSSDLGEKNKNHFDNVASTIFETPWIAKLTLQIQEELVQEIDWISYKKSSTEAPTKMLDYACGNGIASRALAPYYTTIVGMDISEGMVKQYNIESKSAGYSQEHMHAIHGDLINGAAEVDEKVSGFDLIVMSMALHHVQEPNIMIQRLSERLVDGGVLLIVDWVAPSESGCSPPKPPENSPVVHTVSHFGFEKAELDGWFTEAGLNEFDCKWFSKRSQLPEEMGGEKQLLLVRGVKG